MESVSDQNIVTRLFQQCFGGAEFQAVFIRRTDGTTRLMRGALSHTTDAPRKGVGLAFDPSSKDLASVFDLDKGEFRFINLREIVALKVGEQDIVINERYKRHADLVGRLIRD